MSKLKQTDGTGAPIDDAALYYIQDTRQVVGNCGSWWAPNGAGYVCTIDDAGQYTGKYVRNLRSTDVPWPVEYVLARTVRHCRVDNQAFRRLDDQRPVPISVRDPSQPLDEYADRRCDGDHFFENICNDCDAAQPAGSCEVCPHMPGSHPSEHYVRRPCRSCGSADLRSVRVRPPIGDSDA